jgi:predicted DNA-binding transcriptional regulator YafY
MERVVRLLTVLHEAGPDGVSGTKLMTIGEYGDKDPGSQLNRDFRQLREQGWRIDNVAVEGEEGRYRLAGGDNRLRLALTEPQQVALQRAALLADRADLVKRLGLSEASRPQAVQSAATAGGPGEELTTVMDAVRRARLLRFRYKGRARVVHPGAVRHQDHQWYLTGVEDGDDVLKHFVVGRMSDVVADAADSARRLPEARLELHPMRWQVDPPTEVVLSTTADFLPDVRRWLGEPSSVTEDGDQVDVGYVVTNRASFRSRVYALGRRVRVVSPDDVRDELLAELADLAGL